MKILVTGSTGHLGEALVRTLREQGKHEIISLDILPSPFTTHVGSISNRSLVKQCLQGVQAILHTATLHKPHVATHTRQAFVDTNITGTLNILEEAVAAKVTSVVFTSTTSTFGTSLIPPKDAPAAWITEETKCRPKNIYGVTKTAAEDLCELFHRNQGLPCLILKTSRFFPEQDDTPAIREAYQDGNIKANEFLYRRVDLQDVVDAHLLALKKAPTIGFGRYIISATTPFQKTDLANLRTNARAVVAQYFPSYQAEYTHHNWKMFPTIERVYVNAKARLELGWNPRYDFRYVLDCLKKATDPRSPLAQAVGSKGYHREKFQGGHYPIS